MKKYFVIWIYAQNYFEAVNYSKPEVYRGIKIFEDEFLAFEFVKNNRPDTAEDFRIVCVEL